MCGRDSNFTFILAGIKTGKTSEEKDNDLFTNLPKVFKECLLEIQTACASFVVGKYVEREDIIKLNWLPVKEHIEWQLLK